MFANLVSAVTSWKVTMCMRRISRSRTAGTVEGVDPRGGFSRPLSCRARRALRPTRSRGAPCSAASAAPSLPLGQWQGASPFRVCLLARWNTFSYADWPFLFQVRAEKATWALSGETRSHRGWGQGAGLAQGIPRTPSLWRVEGRE